MIGIKKAEREGMTGRPARMQAGMFLASALLLTGTVVLSLVAVPTARAQDSDDAPGAVSSRSDAGDRERLSARIEEAIGASDLAPGDRERMREHLRRAQELGLSAEETEALFPLRRMRARREARLALEAGFLLRVQERVLRLAGEGVPVYPVLAKIREGWMKGVPPARIEGALERMEQHVRVAHRVFAEARQAGVRPNDDPAVERKLERAVAMDLWRGLDADDLGELLTRARERARDRDGSCSTLQLAAAAETATQLRELGVERKQAVRLAGEALRQGYAPGDVRRLSAVVLATRVRGEHANDALRHLENGLAKRESLREMVRRLRAWGWMGPEDLRGRGGRSPVDDVIVGGPGDGRDNRSGDNGQSGPGPR